MFFFQTQEKANPAALQRPSRARTYARVISSVLDLDGRVRVQIEQLDSRLSRIGTWPWRSFTCFGAAFLVPGQSIHLRWSVDAVSAPIRNSIANHHNDVSINSVGDGDLAGIC
jgi:hypothetical protein